MELVLDQKCISDGQPTLAEEADEGGGNGILDEIYKCGDLVISWQGGGRTGFC